MKKKELLKVKNGFTMIEALIIIGLTSVGTLTAYNMIKTSLTESNINGFSSKIVKVIKGFDQRVYIDKYESNLWPTVNDYITNVQVQDFFNKELISSKASCGQSSGWNPVIIDPSNTSEVNTKNQLKLIPCDMWKNGKFEFKLNSKLILTKTANKIDKISLYFYYETPEAFKDNYNNLRRIYNKLKEKDIKAVTGQHNYAFVDLTQTNPFDHKLSIKECIEKKNDCGLMAQYIANGEGYENLDVTGQNSMINSKISFVSRENDPVIKTCSSFVLNKTSGIWDRKNNVLCGLGIAPNKGTEFVDADIHNVSSKKIFLDETCSININGSNKTIPCGIYNSESESTVLAVSNELHLENAFIHLLEVETINTDSLHVNENINVKGDTTFAKLDSNGHNEFQKEVNFKASENKINTALDVKGETTLNRVNLKNIVELDRKLTIGKDLTINGGLSAKEVHLGTITKSQINSDCSSSLLGAIKIYRNGGHTEPVICTTFTDITNKTKTAWKLSNARIGQIIPFDGTCPDGFEYFTQAAGRFLIGENETLLKGKSAVEIANLVSQGKVFLDPNGNVLRYKIGDKGGEAFHTLTIEEMPQHDHEVPTIKSSCTGSDCAGESGVRMDAAADTVWSRNSNIKNSEAGQDKKHENRPPYYTVNYCIYSGR